MPISGFLRAYRLRFKSAAVQPHFQLLLVTLAAAWISTPAAAWMAPERLPAPQSIQPAQVQPEQSVAQASKQLAQAKPEQSVAQASEQLPQAKPEQPVAPVNEQLAQAEPEQPVAPGSEPQAEASTPDPFARALTAGIGAGLTAFAALALYNWLAPRLRNYAAHLKARRLHRRVERQRRSGRAR